MKKPLKRLLGLLLLAISAQSFAQQAPYNADIVVAPDSSGDFISLQAAIDAVPSNSELRTIIYIKRGTYNEEKLIVPADKINLTLIGESREETVISYHMHNCDQGMCPVEDAALWTGDNIRTAATLTIMADGFRAENLTIENTAGPKGQAQAITVRGDRVEFVNCTLTGYQDTVYLWSDGKRCYFENCLITGRTDYIYGGAIGFFNMCEIRSWGGGWITAPSTIAEQDYGFVFYACEITYADNSPRPEDDGQLIALGRPWHNCPKVAWINCEMTGMINPLGWNTTWNMDYAADSSGLHLYEYGNTGEGADMSGRADWVGIRELSEEEAANYTAEIVLAGDDGWDPASTPPAVTTYEWTGGGTGESWLLAENWDPVAVPASGEAAVVDGDFLVYADGGDFEADLDLSGGAVLEITDSSTVTLLNVYASSIATSTAQSFEGKIKTKDSTYFETAGDLNLYATVMGVHRVFKDGSGSLSLLEDNSGFNGTWVVREGTLLAGPEYSLGGAALEIESGASAIISHANAMQPDAPLYTVSGASLELNADLTLSQFYIDGSMQDPGLYDAQSHPDLISGDGRITVGRPTSFDFVGGSSGVWDEASHYLPALMPGEGDTVYCEREIETTETIYRPTLFIQNGGRLRLRGDASKNHRATGNIHMAGGTSIAYNTSGTGMAITAPLVIEGNVILNMESGDAAGSIMTLKGSISGGDTVFARNNGKGNENYGKVMLQGDNSGFSGVWDLTLGSDKYPDLILETEIEGTVEDAFGPSRIIAGDFNRIILNHKYCAGDSLDIVLSGNAIAELKTLVLVKAFYLNGEKQENGTYTSETHPEVFEGSGQLVVDAELAIPAGPTDLEATDIQHNQVGLSWTINSDNADGFVIRKDYWIADTVVSDTFTLGGLYPEITYVIGVYAYNLAGNSDTATIEVTTLADPVGLEEHESSGIAVYPNPSGNMLYIEGTQELSWELYSSVGRMLESGRSASIDMTGHAPGTYILNIRDDEGLWKPRIIIKE